MSKRSRASAGLPTVTQELNEYEVTTTSTRPTRQRTVARLYRMPRSGHKKVFKFRRQIQQVMTVTQNGGWANAGFDLCIAPALGQCDIIISGTLVYQPVLPNASEFTNLFDQFRITRVYCEIIYSGNDNNTNTPTYVLPVIHIMNDYNTTGGQTLTDYEQHPELQTRQLGVGKRIRWSFVPRTRGDLLTNSGVTSTSANNKALQWIDTNGTNVAFLGTRAYFNNFNRNVVTDIGSVMLVVKYDMEFRFVK